MESRFAMWDCKGKNDYDLRALKIHYFHAFLRWERSRIEFPQT